MKNEPVAVTAAVTAAMIATVALLGLVFNWTPELVAAIDAVIAGWVIAIAALVRSRVSPSSGQHPVR